MLIPAYESLRMNSLRKLRILDTPTEERYDRIVKLAAQIFDFPVAYISLVDNDRQWFKSKVGIDKPETPRDISFCGHTILENRTMIIEDTLLDERFNQNPLVTGPGQIRFYAGRPLSVETGLNVGSLCLMDRVPRKLSARDLEVLDQLGKLVEHEFRMLELIEVQYKFIDSQKELAQEKAKSDGLLRNILPDEIAYELKQNGKVEARAYEDVSVIFTDFTGFTSLSSSMSPEQIVHELNICFTAFDQITEDHEIEKLKTIGDGYMAVSDFGVCGMQGAMNAVRCALEMREFIRSRHKEKEEAGEKYWKLKVGLHIGPIAAGVVGSKKFIFDVWGDTVNMAARLESASEADHITASGEFAGQVRHMVKSHSRGMVTLKGKGEVEVFDIENGIF
ncbi:MAG: adenylate/guanylate cyclase domain-containing protein [Verrucomicrobiota bacterium]|nr:adenylate/guanylate cyclase domain-containing protein [Verrucomicrobiota bacterium]